MKSAIAAVAIVLAVVAVAVLIWWPHGDRFVIDPGDAAVVAEGREVYVRECAACHGARRQGQPDWRLRGPDGLLPAPPLDGSAHDWHHPDGQLFVMVRDGPASQAPPGYRSAMPAFGGRLSTRDIVAALAFIKQRWPDEARQRQAEITRRSPASGQ